MSRQDQNKPGSIERNNHAQLALSQNIHTASGNSFRSFGVPDTSSKLQVPHIPVASSTQDYFPNPTAVYNPTHPRDPLYSQNALRYHNDPLYLLTAKKNQKAQKASKIGTRFSSEQFRRDRNYQERQFMLKTYQQESNRTHYDVSKQSTRPFQIPMKHLTQIENGSARGGAADPLQNATARDHSGSNDRGERG